MVQRGGEGGALAAITNWEQQPNVAGPKATDAAVYTDTGYTHRHRSKCGHKNTYRNSHNTRKHKDTKRNEQKQKPIKRTSLHTLQDKQQEH
jgi:hypothetical protein